LISKFNVAVDLVFWMVAVFLSVAVEAFVVLRVLRLPISSVLTGANPLVWVAQFCQPLIALPILTVALRRRGERWSSLGLIKPSTWWLFARQVAIGLLVLCVAGYLIRQFIIAPLQLPGTGSVSFSGIRGNVAAFIPALAYALLGVGLNEELQFRGFIQSRIAKALGDRATSWRVAVVITGLLFGIAHGALGPANMVYAALGGIVVGGIYLWADRNLWVVVAIHSLFDVMRLVQFFVNGNDLPM